MARKNDIDERTKQQKNNQWQKTGTYEEHELWYTKKAPATEKVRQKNGVQNNRRVSCGLYICN